MRRALPLLSLLSIPLGCGPAQPPADASSSTVVVPVASTTAPSPPPPEPSPPVDLLAGQLSIHPQKGLTELPVGKATRKDLVARLGEPDQVETHGTYSVSLKYAAGFEATYCQGDETQLIRWQSFVPPLTAHVDNRAGAPPILLGKTTLGEAIDLRGECEWTTADGSDQWTCTYKTGQNRTLGLLVERDTSVPAFPLDKTRHLDKPILEIEVAVDFAGCHVLDDMANP